MATLAGAAGGSKCGFEVVQVAGFGRRIEFGDFCLQLVRSLFELGRIQISGLALVSPLSVPSVNVAQCNLDITSTTAALSAAALASNGTRPWAMAPMRPKC